MSPANLPNGPAASQQLLHCLSKVYHDRVQHVLDSLSRMGPRYYLRLNTLTAPALDILKDMLQNGYDLAREETVSDAAYLPVRDTLIEPREIVVEADRFAAEAVMQGAHLYAPGVKKCQGLQTRQSVSITGPNGTIVGSGESTQSETSILTYRQGMAVRVSQSRFGLPSLMETPWFVDGQIHLQSLPAMVTCKVLDPKPGDTILDLNCAPGGKMSFICQLTGNQARVVGFDRNKQKIQRTKHNLDRLKCDNYALIVHDSRYAHIDYKFQANKILVDPPCTALGVTPKLSIDKDFQDVTNLAAYQKQFLTAAAALAKPGGTIVYSVCTVSLEECEETARFAEEQLGLEQVEATPKLGRDGLDQDRLSQRFDPEIDGCGYFIAKFVKN